MPPAPAAAAAPTPQKQRQRDPALHRGLVAMGRMRGLVAMGRMRGLVAMGRMRACTRAWPLSKTWACARAVQDEGNYLLRRPGSAHARLLHAS